MSATKTIRLGDAGTEFRLSYTYKDENNVVQVLSIANANVNEVSFRWLDDNSSPMLTIHRTAQLLTDGTDGVAVYYGQRHDFLCAGRWELQGHIEIPGSSPQAGSWRTEPVEFEVEFIHGSLQAQAPSFALTLTLPDVVVS